MNRIIQREEGALALLYDRYASASMSVAVRILGDPAEAEDVLQDVFLKVWQGSAAAFDTSRGSVAAWFMSSVRNASIDRIRRRDAQKRAVEGSAQQPRPEPPERAPAEDQQRVVAEVAKLPPDQRKTIEMAYFDGLSQSQIAEKLGEPLGTVKTRMRLAMKKLRQAFVGMPQEAK